MTARGYTGVIAGVTFEDGEAVTKAESLDDPKRAVLAVVSYARRHGLRIVNDRLVIDDGTTPESPDPRKIGFLGSGIEQVGTHLRDAAVDPRPEDYLAPTNAGEANPHGPEVVSPEIHGSQGVRPVKGGAVPEQPVVQEAVETAHAAEVTDVESTGERPAKSASKAEWVAFAVTQGADPGEAEASSKADLIATHGGDA